MAVAINGTGSISGVPAGGMQDGAGPVLGTSQASTSGTSIDFTGIPSWAKRVTVMFNGVSTSGSSFIRIQVGSGSIVNSGYSGLAISLTAGQAVNANSSTNLGGFDIYTYSGGMSAASAFCGSLRLDLLGSNVWVANGFFGSNQAQMGGFIAAASPTLSGTLDRVRITTVNGTDTFDAGSINIMYE